MATSLTINCTTGERTTRELTASEVAEAEAESTAMEGPKRFDELRRDRNKKLAETDFHSLSDTSEMSSEMASYREALRQLPEQYDYETIRDGITWPTKPD
jgi:hypothetical protein